MKTHREVEKYPISEIPNFRALCKPDKRLDDAFAEQAEYKSTQHR